MGLDIFIGVNNREEIYTPEYHSEENDYYSKHRLSRTFCNFICRKNVVEGDPELDQIGKLSGVDITSFYEMEMYWDEESMEHQLTFASSEEDRERIMRKIQSDRESIVGNIDKVLRTLNLLIEKLSSIQDLPSRLSDNSYDTLDNSYYFSDFNNDKGEGYMGNNFGQDLRNFRRFLEFAKARGTTTVYFVYG